MCLQTIFEICTTKKSLPGEVMRATRAKFGGLVAKHQAVKQERLATAKQSGRGSSDVNTKRSLEPMAEENIVVRFGEGSCCENVEYVFISPKHSFGGRRRVGL